MFLRVHDHHMQLYPMGANHQSNDAKFVIYRSSLMTTMTTMTTMNLQAIAASDYHDNHDHIHFDYYFHHEWVLFAQERLEMTTTMIVDLAMTGCYGIIATETSWWVISAKTVNLRHFRGRAHACDQNEVALLYNLLVFVFWESLVVPPGPTF